MRPVSTQPMFTTYTLIRTHVLGFADVRCADDPTALRTECFCTQRRTFIYAFSVGILLLVIRFVYTESAAIASIKFTSFYDDDGDKTSTCLNILGIDNEWSIQLNKQIHETRKLLDFCIYIFCPKTISILFITISFCEM